MRRTRPDMVRQIDQSLIRAITDAGGRITGERFLISAVFNEETIGFWLDIYILIENLKKNLDISTEFFGYSLVITSRMPAAPELLCRFLANGEGGIYMDGKVVKRFIPYAEFEKPSEWSDGRRINKYGSDKFFRIKELNIFKPAPKNGNVFQKIDVFEQSNENTLMTGKAFSQMRNCLYAHCNKLNEDFPPLTICFGSIGLGALVDAWSSNIRSLVPADKSEEIDFLWELLFRDRIRDEVSDFIFRSVRRFLALLLEYYFNAARRKNRTPVLLLDNIHLAGKKITNLLLDALADINNENKRNFLILGTADNDISHEKLQLWKGIFKNVVITDGNKNNKVPKLTMELWEIIYSVSLLGRYFSPELFQRLFEEAGKNPIMISRAFSIIHMLGVIDNPREPWPIPRYFEDHARKVLGGKAFRVKEMVRGRLLSWAEKQKINPCFRLLTILAAMASASGANNGKNSLASPYQIDDLFLLKSITSDIANDTIMGLESALKNGQLEELVSAQRAAAIRYIFRTSRALYTGKEDDIDKVFMEQPFESLNSGFDAFPVLKAQIIVNLSGYYLGRHNIAAAADKAKEAILLGQTRNTFCLPQAYRLFSLVCLLKQQAAETNEYLDFALANAEKTGNYHEMGISAYYAAAAQFLYGDIYKAARLARRSIDKSITAGRPDWADRSRFLEGRLEFELGHYSEAHDIFETLRKKPYGNITPEKDSLLAAWIYRSQIYFLDPNISKPEPANHDADLFEIEAAYLSGDYKKAVDLSMSMSNPFSKDNFLYTEQPNWSSGFAQCEQLYFSPGEIQNRIICLFHSLSLCHLSPQSGADAVQEIQRILRDERLCEMDPWDAFYYYAKYRILEKADAHLVDMSTAVSIAFKRLQRRASRIEDIETRRQYLNGSRWNRELGLAAKDFKLI